MRDTVGDIDILATAADSAQLMAAFSGLPNVAEVIASGGTKTSIRTTAGVRRICGSSAAVLGRRTAIFHRGQGTQHPHPRNRRPQEAQAFRVRVVRRGHG